MNTVHLNKDGTMLDDQKKPISGPLRYLGCRVELEDGYLLRSFFKMIVNYPVLNQLNAFFPSYLEQYHACPAKNCDYAGFDRLEFNKTIEMIGFPGEPQIEIYHSLNGVQGKETVEIKSSRLDGLLDIPVTLGRLKHVVFGDKMDVFEFDTVFSLFEFIDGIAWELSFHGTPEACGIRR